MELSKSASHPCTFISLFPIILFDNNGSSIRKTLGCFAFGPWVEVHCLSESCGKKTRFLGFDNQKYNHFVHGIQSTFDWDINSNVNCGHQLTIILGIYGGRQLMLHELVVIINEDGSITHIETRALSKVFVFCDWVFDLRLILKVQDKCIDSYVCLAHNQIECWRLDLFDSPETTFSLLNKIKCSQRCICFCMSFYGWDNDVSYRTGPLSVAVGTFNHIYVWGQHKFTENDVLDESTIDSNPKIVFQDHKGVIFKLRWSSCGKLLCSACDDRSVRLYDMAKETCVWVGWGHTARVWDVYFCSHSPYIISSAEDGTVRLWYIDDGSLRCVIDSHACSIWRIGFVEEAHTILAGGNDGVIKLWHLGECFSRMPLSPTVQETATTSPTKFKIPTDNELGCINKRDGSKLKQIMCGIEIVSAVASDTQYILIATRAGGLASFRLESKKWVTHPIWNTQRKDEKEYQLVGECIATCPYTNTCAIGCCSGEIILTSLSIEKESFCFKTSKNWLGVKSLRWFYDNWLNKKLAILVGSHIRGNITVLGFAIRMLHKFGTSEEFVHIRPDFERSLRMHTVGVPISFSFNAFTQSLLVGDTRGNVTYFDKCFDVSGPEVVDFRDKIERAHGREHVTGISHEIDNRFFTAGADGYIVQFEVDHTSMRISKYLSYPVSNFASLSHIWYFNEGKTIILGGFLGNSFKIYNFSTKQIMSSVQCGGKRQRLHDVFLSPYTMTHISKKSNGDHSLHIFSDIIENKDLSNVRKIGSNATKIFGQRSHGDTMYTLCLIESSFQDRLYLFSGSNNCTFSCFNLNAVKSGIEISSSFELPCQMSCVRAICSSKSIGSNAHIVVCAGGSLSLNIYVLENSFDVKIKLLATCARGAKEDIDQRINGVSAISTGLSTHVVITGDSDGTVALLKVDTNKVYQNPIKAEVVCSGISQRPILCLKVVRIGSLCVGVFGNTNGEIAVWQLGKVANANQFHYEPRLLITFKFHQAGTNCVDSYIIGKKSGLYHALIVTGSDDQSLSVCIIAFAVKNSEADLVNNIASTRKIKGHASAIKSVKLIHSHTDENEFLIFSVGCDQKICSWKLHIYSEESIHDSYTIELMPIEQILTEISDTSCMACSCIDKNFIAFAVGGQGLQLLAHKQDFS